jgi:hypothetical protein
MAADGYDKSFVRGLVWLFTLVGFELVALAVGMYAGPPVGVLLAGVFLSAWSLVTFAAVSGG